MDFLTKLIQDDMKPALGVTEPGAIAYAVSTAKSYLKGEIKHIQLRLNSGMFKNAFTCGIPNSSHVGNYFAAALGAVAGNPKKGLECLADVTARDNEKAEELVSQGKITVEMKEITSRIYIEAQVVTSIGNAVVYIRDSHTNIEAITVDGQTVFEKEVSEAEGVQECHSIHDYTLKDLAEYASSVDIHEIDFINAAFEMNYELFKEGLENPRTTYARYLLKENGGEIISGDEQKTASLLCNGAIEARVLGLDKPAMSITGSGAHGIIATMPLYGVYRVKGYSQEQLLRAAALSYLVCMYIKEYSGKLSAFCGCAIAAGTGMACGLVYLKGGDLDVMAHTINNMASSITGMICDGGNQGCVMKGIVAVDAAFSSVNQAMAGVYIYNAHGINGADPETTMYHMGRIASPGMVGTEAVIVEILEEKKPCNRN